MTVPELVDWRAVEVRVCGTKVRYGAKAARARADSYGNDVRPYRCPFCGGYHVGHAPSMQSVETIAAAIRARAQDPAA